MAPIEYKVGEMYELETIEIRQTPFGSDYIALRDDVRDTYRAYNILKCQYETLPEKIQVECVSVDEFGRPKLRQDFYPILKSLYKKGECYRFTVTDEKTDYNSMDKVSYYQVEDDNAIHRMYIHDGKPNLEIGKEVVLQVELINAKGYLDLKVPEVEPTVVVDTQVGVANVSVRTGKRPRIKKGEPAPTLLDVNEDTHNELKTSIVFKEGKADIDNQMFVIARELVALMNTDGGNLYIGVTDQDHRVQGIEADYPFLNSSDNDDYNGSYKESEDGYELKIRNYMRWASQGVANELMEFEFKRTADGKTYCIINVKKSSRPVWLRGNMLYIRTGNKVDLKTGDNLTDFIIRKMSRQINPGITEEQITKSFLEMLNVHRKSVAAAPKPQTAEKVYFLNWKDDATCVRTKKPLTDTNVIFQIPVTKDLYTADLYFCYDGGTVNKISLAKFKQGRNLGDTINRAYYAKRKLMNIFLAHGTQFIAVYGADEHGYEYVKVHRMTDIPSTEGASNQGSRIVPTGMEARKYKLVHAIDINNCKRLLVDSAAGRTNNKGTALNSVACPDDIKYIDNYPLHITD